MDIKKTQMTNLPDDNWARKKKIIRNTILIASILIVLAIIAIIIAIACRKDKKKVLKYQDQITNLLQ